MDYDIYILFLLSFKSYYGYELKKKLSRHFSACSSVSNNSIYPLLSSFYRKGFVTKTKEEISGKPDRIIYSITKDGKSEFSCLLYHFNEKSIESRESFFTHLVFFSYLTPDARTEVLDIRENILKSNLNNLKTLLENDDKMTTNDTYRTYTRFYHEHTLNTELDTIDKFRKHINDEVLTLN